jgi:putative holliday junction resolvase
LLRATRYTYTVSQSYSSSQEITPSAKRRTRILGIDYGRARIGLAIADAIAALARPLETLERINRNEDMRRLREVVRNHGVKQIVVGLPLRLDGTRGEMAEEASRFAERVRKQLGVPVEMVDERLTSWEAERLLEEQAGRVLRITPRGAGENARKRAHLNSADSGQRKRRQAQPRSSVDAIAAAVILKEYLERQVAKEST